MPLSTFAGELPKDCINAINVCKPVYHFTEVYFGEGSNRNEISSDLSCLKRGENNSLWFIVKVKTDGELGFLITPDGDIDLDWSVYNLTNSSCSRIAVDNTIEVSCNFSDASNFTAENGKTGPTGGFNQTHGDMNSSPYNKKIPVKAGQTYAIAVVSWWTNTNGGFTVDFNLSTADIFDTTAPELLSIDNDACGGEEVRVKFSKYIECTSLDKSDFSIDGPGGPYPVTEIISDNCLNSSFGSDVNYVLKVSPKQFKKGEHTLKVVGKYVDVCGIANKSPDEIKFSVKETPVILTAEKSEICPGEKTRLMANVDGVPPFTYKWKPEQFLSCSTCMSPNAMPPETMKFTVTISDGTGCTSEDTITITVRPAPVVNVINGDTAMCEGGTAKLLIEAPGIVNPVYSWMPTVGLDHADIPNPNASPPVSTEYTVTVADPITGCSSVRKITVRIGKLINPVITSSGSAGSVEVCEGSNAVLDAGDSDPDNGEQYSEYQWFKNSQPISDSVRRYLSVTEAGTYSARVISSGGCTGTGSIQVSVIPFPSHTIESPESFCTGSSFTLKAVVNAEPESFSVKWLVTTGFLSPETDTEPEIMLTSEGAYRYVLEISDNTTGCKGYDTLTIDVAPGFTIELGAEINACPGELVSINAALPGSSADYDYYWLPADNVTFPNPNDSSKANIRVYKNEVVYLRAFNNSGCSSVDSVLVSIPVPVAELSLPSGEYSSRQKDVVLPLRLDKESDLIRCNPKFALVKLEWDFSIFNPRKAIARGSEVSLNRNFKQSTHTWEVTINIPELLLSQAGENLVEIIGDVMLGESDTASLYIKSVQWDDFIVNNSFKPGLIRLNDVCTEGSKRLLDYSGAFSVSSVYPNPANEIINIELKSNVVQSIYNIKLIGIFGDIIDEISIFNPGLNETGRFVVGNLSTGVYKLFITNGVVSEYSDVLIIR